jgi:hypothetical protein
MKKKRCSNCKHAHFQHCKNRMPEIICKLATEDGLGAYREWHWNCEKHESKRTTGEE